jgi:hypothetical protein
MASAVRQNATAPQANATKNAPTAYYPADATDDLAAELEEVDCSDPSELSALFGDDKMIFELVEPGRGRGHDTSSCLVVLGAGASDADD